MKLHAAAIGHLTQSLKPRSYIRLIPAAHRSTPLGTGRSNTRFSSPTGSFDTLYAARTLRTAVAETVIRDRFQGRVRRLLHVAEFDNKCAVDISALRPLQLLDLRGDGCLKLGVSTDIARAKGWKQSRQLAQHIHDHTNLDGILYSSRLTGEDCIAVFGRAISTGLTSNKVADVRGLRDLSDALRSMFVELVF